MADALIAREKYEQARIQQERAVRAYEVAVQVATERYVAGRAGYFEILQEQQLLFPAEKHAGADAAQPNAGFRAALPGAGGGWSLPEH